MFVKLEYVIANAIVDLNDKNGGRSISIKNVKEYGERVTNELNKKYGDNYIFQYSNEYMKDFLREYSDYFLMVDDTLYLKDGIASTDIIEHILCYTPSKVLTVLLDTEFKVA